MCAGRKALRLPADEIGTGLKVDQSIIQKVFTTVTKIEFISARVNTFCLSGEDN